MNQELIRRTDLMVSNFQAIKKTFVWDMNISKHFAAMIAANRDSIIDSEKIKKVRDYIKQETSWMSYFRGNSEFIVSSLLSNRTDYEALFDRVEDVYEIMKNAGFRRGSYLPLAALTLAMDEGKRSSQEKVDRAKHFYEMMKKNHFWLTGEEDYVLSSVLACSDLDIDGAFNDIEECYKILIHMKFGFSSKNELQNLSHILALGDEKAERKCARAEKIYSELKKMKCKLSYFGLTALGVLTLATDDNTPAAEEVKLVFDYLKTKEGYGSWSLDSGTRAILATIIVADYYADNIKNGLIESAISNSINSIIIAEQVAVAAAMSAAVTASAASSSS